MTKLKALVPVAPVLGQPMTRQEFSDWVGGDTHRVLPWREKHIVGLCTMSWWWNPTIILRLLAVDGVDSVPRVELWAKEGNVVPWINQEKKDGPWFYRGLVRPVPGQDIRDPALLALARACEKVPDREVEVVLLLEPC